jgi:5-formyltetrahydrofolate cyclo-ligase
MEDIKIVKRHNVDIVAERLGNLKKQELDEKYKIIENRLFEFANFFEAQMVSLYISAENEIPTENIIKKTLAIEKGVVIPVFADAKNTIRLYKINNYSKDLIKSSKGIIKPASDRCKEIALEDVNVALIPGLVFDDKGGRIGRGDKFFTKLINRLPETCRKISVAYEEQIIDQIQMESRKTSVDIIITDKRIIYKI